MEELKPPFEAEYVREHGAHEFYAVDGTPIWAVSVPDLPSLCKVFVRLPQTHGYIVTPELITGPQRVQDIPSNKEQILNDLEIAKEMSAQQPNAHLFIGTPTFDNPFSKKPRNSLLIFKKGKEVGRVNKRYILSQAEQEVFESDIAEAPALLPTLGHAAIICSDLLMPNRFGNESYGFIAPSTKTLIVASKWASPLVDRMEITDERFKNPLETQVQTFFERFPNLLEIIMVDRSSEETGLKPFNAHFKRVES